VSELHRTSCFLDCPDGCSLEVPVADGRVGPLRASDVNPGTAGFICSKVRDFGQRVHHAERLLHPQVRTGSKGAAEFRRASWDEALDLVAARLGEVRARSGGEALVPLSYGGSNGFLSQDSLDRAFLSRFGASRLLRTVCAAPTGAAALGLYGKMVGVAFEDYAAAELIVVWGANPEASGIHLVPLLKRAQAAGAKLVVVDPRRTQLAKKADLHLAPRPGTDLALALALHRHLFEVGGADAGFLAEHATGADELRARAAEWTPERAAEVCGLGAAEVVAFAETYAAASPAVIRCGWGQERNRNGGSATAAILALPAVAGKFGVRGGGYTMTSSKAWDLAPTVADAPPATRAINMNELGRDLLERDDPRVEALLVYNANPLATLPNQRRVREGIAREDLFTVVIEQVMTDTARYADVLLPCPTFLEQRDLRLSYGTPVLLEATPVVAPEGESRSNVWIFRELLARLDLARDDDPADEEALAAAALRDLPAARAALDRDGWVAPPTHAGGAGPVQFVDVFPLTADGKVHLCPAALDAAAPLGLYCYRPDPGTADTPLALISPSTGKTISSTLGELVEGLVPVTLHPDDAAARGIADGVPVRIANELGEVRTAARVSDEVRPGVASLPKGLWERHTANGETANALAPDALADLGGGACFNDARVQVARIVESSGNGSTGAA
jgi:anaerobic selenocysteine-containing dehydrogenase